MALIDNIISYWSFDSSNSNDSVGGHNGTDTSISYGAGKISNCAYNTTATGKIATGSWSLPAAFSVAAWVKVDTSKEFQVLFSTYAGSAGSSAANLYIHGNATLGVDYSNFSVETGWTSPLTTNTWAHVVLTHNGTTAIIYINGVNSKSGTVAHVTTTATFNIMSRGDEATQRMKGYVDEMGVWGRTLSSDEVTSLYNSGSGLAYPFTTTAPANPAFLLNFIN